MCSSRATLALSLVVAAATAAPAQIVAVDVERAIDDLAVPARQWDAGMALVRAGAAALPKVKALLRTHQERPASAVTVALLVAGRFGRDAVALLPDVLEVYRMGQQPEVRRQALWAAGQIAPFAPPAARDEAREFLKVHFAPGGDLFLFACVDERIALGSDLESASLRELLESKDSARGIAVAEALAALPAEQFAADTELGPQLRDLLTVRLERPLQPWDVDTARECEIGPLAAAAWAAGDRSPLTARGLMQHWDPELRLAALIPLAHGALLSPAERWDVVLRLWDPVPAVRDLAFGTMRGWNEGFAIAVPALLSFGGGTDRAFAAASTQAVERWLATAPAVVAAAVAALRGEEVARAAVPAKDAERGALAALVMGSRGLANGELGKLARFVRTHDLASADVVDAFLWCVVADGAAWRAALSALVELGPAAAARRPDIATQLVRSAFFTAPEEVGPIVEAWMRSGPSASAAELGLAAASDDWLVVARAFAETVQRGQRPDATMVRGALAARARIFTDVFVTTGQDWAVRRGGGLAWVTKTADHELVLTLATLVLLAADDDRWRDGAALRACVSRCGEGTTEESLRAARVAGQLGELSRKLEAPLRPSWLDVPGR